MAKQYARISLGDGRIKLRLSIRLRCIKNILHVRRVGSGSSHLCDLLVLKVIDRVIAAIDHEASLVAVERCAKATHAALHPARAAASAFPLNHLLAEVERNELRIG